MSITTIQAEKESLETHVDLCAQRYGELENRLTSVETKLDDLEVKITEVQNSIKGSLIKAVGAIIVALITSTATIVAVLINHPVR
jgi:predicted  nucleic acid-binding Zn-ribbon protein